MHSSVPRSDVVRVESPSRQRSSDSRRASQMASSLPPRSSPFHESSLNKYTGLSKPAQDLLHLLATSTAMRPARASDLRQQLDALRDHCLSLHERTKFSSVGNNVLLIDDDVNAFLAVTFMSSLFFPTEAVEMSVESLETALQRLMEAERSGGDREYHNAVVDTVGHILLFTPLAAPPSWGLQGMLIEATFSRNDRRSSIAMPQQQPTDQIEMDALLQTLNRPGSPTYAESHVINDDCLDYLTMNGGAPLLVESTWVEVWLSWFQRGYERIASDVLGVQDRALLPQLLPRPYWRSAENAYAQFSLQLLAIFFARGSDGSLNYCARVHKLVKYYHYQLQRAKRDGAGIPVELAAVPEDTAHNHIFEKQYRFPVHQPLSRASSFQSGRSLSVSHSPSKSQKSSPPQVLLYRNGSSNSKIADDSANTRLSLQATISRKHKCYTMDDTLPEMRVMRRVMVDAE